MPKLILFRFVTLFYKHNHKTNIFSIHIIYPFSGFVHSNSVIFYNYFIVYPPPPRFFTLFTYFMTIHKISALFLSEPFFISGEIFLFKTISREIVFPGNHCRYQKYKEKPFFTNEQTALRTALCRCRFPVPAVRYGFLAPARRRDPLQ